MWGKVRKPLQSNQLIMISRVPGYGQLEYLVLEYRVNLNMLLLINVVARKRVSTWNMLAR